MSTSNHLLGLVCAATFILPACGDDDSGNDDNAAGSSETGNADTMQQDDGVDDGVDDGMNTDTGMMTETGMADTAGTETGMADTAGTETGMADTAGTETGMAADLPLNLNLMGYDPHEGQEIHIKIFDDADTELGALDDTATAEGSYTIEDVVTDGGTYTVRWWVDLNGDTMCTPQPDDHMWEMTALTADATGLTIDHPHDAEWVDVCGSW